MIFVGEEDRGYFAREAAKKLKKELRFVPYSPTIEQQINAILEAKCGHMIFDIEQYLDRSEILAEEIRRLAAAKSGTTMIVYAPGYSPAAKIIQLLKENGVQYFILSAVPGEAKEQLERCLMGYYREEEEALEPIPDTPPKEGKKIGFVGACHRMGTTTQALQMVKYLQMNGYKACYIQVNASRYVEDLERYFYSVHDRYLGKVLFADVDLYYKQENISEVLRQGYDYYVYDFGVYSDTDFNKILFQEKDIRIFVMGSKPNEIVHTNEILRNEYYKDATYLFSFVSEAEKPDLLALMEERAGQTYFSGYVPDPFDFTACSRELYGKLMTVEGIVAAVPKKRFFRRR